MTRHYITKNFFSTQTKGVLMKKLRDILVSVTLSGLLGFLWLQLSYYVKANAVNSNPNTILGTAYMAVMVFLGLATIFFAKLFNRLKPLQYTEESIATMIMVSSLTISVFAVLEGSYEPKSAWPIMFFIIFLCSFFFNALSVYLFYGKHLFKEE